MKSQSDRIALFLPLLVGAGAERVILNLAHGFVSRGHKVDFVLGRAEGPFLDQLPQEVRLVDLKASRVLTSLPALVRYLKTERPRALISALDHANIAALWAKRLAGVDTRIIITLHNTVSEKMKTTPLFSRRKLFPFMIRRFFPGADAIVAVSNGVAGDYAKVTGIPLEKFQVIYNPVITSEVLAKAAESLDHPWFNPDEPPVILSVGRLSEQKNYSKLIEAFSVVREKQAARLMILGEGELREDLETQISELKLDEHVALPGFVINPYKYMSRAAVFALSSKWEGLPTVLIEALAVGAAVVSTNCRSGPEEILMGGALGRLVPVDDARQLAQAIVECLGSEKNVLDQGLMKRYEPEWAVNDYLKVVEGERCG